ncbi:MAG: cytochrome ubiquinol oxidase subunit II, partial [Rubrivivax sp.]
DPHKPLASEQPPLDVQVVSLDWKWLFIQPAAGVASVNRLVVPAGTPLRLLLTSATVMNSFFVPQLGSQLYTMPRMTTQLHLMADRPGIYPGFSAQFSGDGFSSMRFELVALAPADYQRWLQTAQRAPATLDRAAYEKLSRPGTDVDTANFGSVEALLFQRIAGGDEMASVCSAPVAQRRPRSDDGNRWLPGSRNQADVAMLPIEPATD